MADVINPAGLPSEDYADEGPEPVTTAAERLGQPVAHSHGASGPHVHMAEDYAQHQQPIEDEQVYARLPAPGRPAPATWFEGPYAAASSLRRWAETLDSGEPLHGGAQLALARDLRGAASVLDGASR